MNAVPGSAWVALGGNLGPVRERFAAAIDAIAALPSTTVVRRSSLYRTPAWGRTDQPDFLNAVVELRTTLAPAQLLASLLRIEQECGRIRDPAATRWGPRALDLDLLLHGDGPVDEPGLTLPHPRLHERAFVLVPLAEIAPALVVPGRGRVDALLARVDVAAIEALP